MMCKLSVIRSNDEENTTAQYRFAFTVGAVSIRRCNVFRIEPEPYGDPSAPLHMIHGDALQKV